MMSAFSTKNLYSTTATSASGYDCYSTLNQQSNFNGLNNCSDLNGYDQPLQLQSFDIERELYSNQFDSESLKGLESNCNVQDQYMDEKLSQTSSVKSQDDIEIPKMNGFKAFTYTPQKTHAEESDSLNSTQPQKAIFSYDNSLNNLIRTNGGMSQNMHSQNQSYQFNNSIYPPVLEPVQNTKSLENNFERESQAPYESMSMLPTCFSFNQSLNDNHQQQQLSQLINMSQSQQQKPQIPMILTQPVTVELQTQFEDSQSHMQDMTNDFENQSEMSTATVITQNASQLEGSQLTQRSGRSGKSIILSYNQEQFVDFSRFPCRFANEEEALQTYNAMGLPYKIQFKKFQRQRDENGQVIKFMLCCHRKAIYCPVQVRFRWSPEKQHYVRCRKMIMQHSHCLEVKDRHFIYNEHVIQDIQLYMDCQVMPAMIQNLVNKKYSVNTKYNDIYHMMKVLKHMNNKEVQASKPDVTQLIECLENMKKKDPEFKFAYVLEDQDDSKSALNPKIDRMLIQTPMMGKYYQTFSDVVFMDATYKTNKQDLALTIISSVSGEGRNIILGFAFLSRETAEHYEWLLKNLVEFNNGKEPGTIITDFDSSMCAAIEKEFNKTTHLLCQWHMMQNLKKHFVFLNKTKKLHQKQLYNHIIECIYTPDPKKFQELQDIIFQQSEELDEQRMSYLRQLFQIKEKWAYAFQPHLFNAGLHVEKRVVEKSFIDHKHEKREVMNNPLLSSLYQHYSRWSFEKMLYQFQESHKLKVKITKGVKNPPMIYTLEDIEGESAIFCVKDVSIKEIFQVVLVLNEEGEITCNCQFFRGLNIYCEHIFAVFNQLQVKNPLKFRSLSRWTKECQGGIYKEEEKEFHKKYDFGNGQVSQNKFTLNGLQQMNNQFQQALPMIPNAFGIPADNQQPSQIMSQMDMIKNHMKRRLQIQNKKLSQIQNPEDHMLELNDAEDQDMNLKDRNSNSQTASDEENEEEDVHIDTLISKNSQKRKQKHQAKRSTLTTKSQISYSTISNQASQFSDSHKYSQQVLKLDHSLLNGCRDSGSEEDSKINCD
eukprot:403348024